MWLLPPYRVYKYELFHEKGYRVVIVSAVLAAVF